MLRLRHLSRCCGPAGTKMRFSLNCFHNSAFVRSRIHGCHRASRSSACWNASQRFFSRSSSRHSGSPSRSRKAVPLVVDHRDHLEVAVLHRRHLPRVERVHPHPGAAPRLTGEDVGRDPRAGHHRAQDVDDRDPDVLPAVARAHSPPPQQRRDGPVNPALILRRVVRQPQRRLVGVADSIRDARSQRARQRSRLPVLTLRPDPKGRDRHDDQLGMLRREVVPAQAELTLLGDVPRRDHRLAGTAPAA